MSIYKTLFVFSLLALTMASGCTCRPAVERRAEITPGEEDFSIPVTGDALIDSSIYDAVVLNPLIASDSPSMAICNVIFSSLIRYNTEYELEGVLARDFEVVTNPAVLYVHLRNQNKCDDDPNAQPDFHAGDLLDLLKERISSDSIEETDELGKILSDVIEFQPVVCRATGTESCLRITWNAAPPEQTASLLQELIPDEAFRRIDEQTVLTFRLRDDVFWHDGHPFSAEDVLFTWSAITNPDFSIYNRGSFNLVDEVKQVTRYQVRVTYKTPFAPAIQTWGRRIIPRHILEGKDLNTDDFNRAPIGTGPYIFGEWLEGQRMTLVANENYFEGSPNISRYINLIIPDASIQMVKMMAEEIDHMNLTPDQYQNNASTEEFKSRFQIYNYPDNTGYTYMGYNQRSPLFNDRKVRRALTQAIDRNLLIEGVLRGSGQMISGPFPLASWAYHPDIEPWPHDPDESLRLLAEVGWNDRDPDGVLVRDIDGERTRFSFTLKTNHGNEIRNLACRLIARQLSEIGIEANVEFLEWSRLLDDIDNLRFEAISLGWGLAMDPDQYSTWHSSQIPDPTINHIGNNFVGYRNPEVDELLESGRTTLDQDERREIYRRIHELIHLDQPYTFLFAENTITALHNRFHGIELKKTGIWHNFIEWYVPASLQKYRF